VGFDSAHGRRYRLFGCRAQWAHVGVFGERLRAAFAGSRALCGRYELKTARPILLAFFHLLATRILKCDDPRCHGHNPAGGRSFASGLTERNSGEALCVFAWREDGINSRNHCKPPDLCFHFLKVLRALIRVSPHSGTHCRGGPRAFGFPEQAKITNG